MNLIGKRVLIVGLGKTGEAAANFLLGRGARVTISEIKTAEELGNKVRFWKEMGAAVETGRHILKTFLGVDLIIPSPGAASLPELKEAKKAGIKVISEIELAFHFLKGRIVGITGTNGKSTTATLAHKILKEAGLKAYLAGNIGTPLISLVEKSRADHVYVTEISSFQLEHVDRFRAAISVFLNVSLNHLDWHASFDDYYSTKKRLVLSQGREDITILNQDDRLVWALAKMAKAKVYAFSSREETRRGCCLKGGWIILRDENEEKVVRTSKVPLPGRHNLENVMAAALVSHCLGVSPHQMRTSVRGFSGLEHRLEKVSTLRRVDFINDSKATTVDATIKALQSFDKRIVLILGGRDKGADFTQLRKPVREKVKKIILLGEAKEKIKNALRRTVPMEEVSSLRGAVSLAFAAAAPGEMVLLAPACTSFDMFKNFEARGRAFKKEVRRLQARYQENLK
jgi:UDP-N-acetylmuramoylalanine--D-glutamate ligase